MGLVTKSVVAIDTGQMGAAVLLNAYELIIHDWVGPKEAWKWLSDMYFSYSIEAFVIENVHAISYAVTNMETGRKEHHSQKGSANFKFGENFGMWQMAVYALNKEPILVNPQTWQSILPAKKSKSDKPSFEIAKKLYPKAPLIYKSKHHGRSDAIMLGHWFLTSYSKGKNG